MGRFLSVLALPLVLAVALPCAGQDRVQNGQDTTAPVVLSEADLRLSGIVAVAGDPRLAVIELAGRGSRMVRVGDPVYGQATVSAIGPDWVRIDGNGEQRTLRLISGPPAAAPEAALPLSKSAGGDPGPPHQRPGPDMLTAEGELQAIIDGVAANGSNTVDVLADAIGAYLGIPAGTEVAVTNMAFGAFDSAAGAKSALDLGGMVRVRIGAEEGGQMRMLYLRAPPPEGPPGPVEVE